MERFADNLERQVVRDDENDWGSDFEEELCSQEIEDNKINEIREANLFKNSPSNVQAPTENTSQAVQEKTEVIENLCVSGIKTGAIPKSGFSYLNNTVNTDDNRSFQITRKPSGNNVHQQRQVSKSAMQSRNAFMNLDNHERQSQAQIILHNDVVKKKTPKKLKPEAFSFLNKLPQSRATANESDTRKERKTLVPTAFSHAENLAFSQSQDNINLELHESLNISNNPIPSAPPLENSTSSNYESITEEPFSEFDISSSSSMIGEKTVKPPLPTRPPPVFKYPLKTFSSSIPTVVESTSSLVISQTSVAYPKLGHSISSPASDLNGAAQDKILSSKAKNRKSLPSAFPPAPKRPLPPLPISKTENVSKIESKDETVKLESPASANVEKWLDEAPIIPDTISSHQTNQFPNCVAAAQHTISNEPATEEELIPSPQQRLAQILTNQTSVDNAVFISQQKIASAINSRAFGSQSSFTKLHTTEKSESENGRRTKELKMIPKRSIENNGEQTKEHEPEQQAQYLEAKEEVNPCRFNDRDALISAMNRPALPQKAPSIQRSVSCTSLVQSMKDLGFLVWSKPEKKRNSDVINLPKKSSRSVSLASSSKNKSTAPLYNTLIPPDEANNSHHVKNNSSILDEKSILKDFPWYHDVDAKEGHLRLLSIGHDGTFLIRPSSRPTEDIRNTMCIYYNGKVRNLHIRRTPEGRYVLGTKNNKTFSSLSELIKHHKEIPVEIVPQGPTPLKPQLYRILLRETPPKLKKLFAVV